MNCHASPQVKTPLGNGAASGLELISRSSMRSNTMPMCMNSAAHWLVSSISTVDALLHDLIRVRIHAVLMLDDRVDQGSQPRGRQRVRVIGRSGTGLADVIEI